MIFIWHNAKTSEYSYGNKAAMLKAITSWEAISVLEKLPAKMTKMANKITEELNQARSLNPGIS